MRKWIAVFLSAMLMFSITACAAGDTVSDEVSVSEQESLQEESSEDTAETSQPDKTDTKQAKILVAYFSATGNTKPIAEKIAELTGGDLYEIVPANPYTDEDLNYSNDDCRANQEQNDDSAHPEIFGTVENMDDYDIIFLGHPIWWGKEPKIMDTFMESYDLSGKTVVNFCTSGGSGIQTATDNMKALSSDANWLTGQRFETGADEETIQAWLDSLNLTGTSGNVMYIKIGEQTLAVEMADNTSAAALLELLRDGDITVNASDYGNFEKVGALGTDLPTNDKQITTAPGDVILYQGNQITVYYDTNSWSFTRLGKVTGMTQEELKAVLGDGDVTMVLSLNN